MKRAYLTLPTAIWSRPKRSCPKQKRLLALHGPRFNCPVASLSPCLATLKRLRGIAPRHTFVLKMLKQVYLQQQDWVSLSELIPYLQKNDVLKGQQLRELERKAYIGLMKETLDQLPAESDAPARIKALNKTWKSLPRELINDSDLVASYVSLLAQNGSEDKAEAFLSDAIYREWDDALVKLYGQIASSNPAKQLSTAKTWVHEHSDNATLQLTLGRLSLLNGQWEQAREHFEKSIELHNSQETYNELLVCSNILTTPKASRN